MNEATKPVHIQVLYNGPEDWRCLVYRAGKVVCQGRGRNEQHAAQAGSQAFRRWLRTERSMARIAALAASQERELNALGASYIRFHSLGAGQ